MTEPKRTKAKSAAAPPSQISVFQFIIATVAFQFLLSYVITETWTWGYKSKWMSPTNWKYLIQPALNLTEAELAQYDGSDPSKPIYLAIDGDVYDVSASPRTYGKGGGYSFFTGRDAARAFGTGCFKDDLTHDLRGLDPSQLNSVIHWKDFFAKSDKYFWVGTVHHDPIDPSTPFWPPCHGRHKEN